MSFSIFPNIAPQGWECPKCHCVYAPLTPMCLSCPPQTITTSDTVTLIPCEHDWNEEITVPACRKCGTMKPVESPWTTTTLCPLGGGTHT
jgi:hypothetical protein